MEEFDLTGYDNDLATDIYRTMVKCTESRHWDRIFVFLNGKSRPFICNGVPSQVRAGDWGGFGFFKYEYLRPPEDKNMGDLMPKWIHLGTKVLIGEVILYESKTWWKHLNMKEVKYF